MNDKKKPLWGGPRRKMSGFNTERNHSRNGLYNRYRCDVWFTFLFFSPYRTTDWQVGAEIGLRRCVERQRNDRRRRAVCSARATVDNGRVPDGAHGDEDNVLKTLRPCFVRVKLLYYIIVVKWNFVLGFTRLLFRTPIEK